MDIRHSLAGHGLVVVISGGTRGIGAATAIELARRQAHLVIIARDSVRGDAFAEDLRRQGAATASFLSADLSLVGEAVRIAEVIRTRHPIVDLLINNAAGMFPKRTITTEGFEKTFALDYLSPMALTYTLMPSLEAASSPRVVNVVSKAAERGHLVFGDLELARGYSGVAAYARAKLALMMGTRAVAKDHPAVHVNCIHPGMTNTGMPPEFPWLFRAGIYLFGRFLATPEEAAARVLNVAVGEAGSRVTGAYFDRDRKAPFPRSARESETLNTLHNLTNDILVKSGCIEKPQRLPPVAAVNELIERRISVTSW